MTANALLVVVWPGLVGEHADHVVLKGVTDMTMTGPVKEAVDEGTCANVACLGPTHMDTYVSGGELNWTE